MHVIALPGANDGESLPDAGSEMAKFGSGRRPRHAGLIVRLVS
jgi:hypothetical protein